MPVNWVDGVTDVNAANLEIMEADTAAKQASAEKAQPNGYASLDGTGKVPLAQLPAMSGGGVDYIGDWGAGTAYKKGDVVRYLGVDYLAVNDSTGQVPGAAAGSAAIGIALPASPIDGQRFTLVDSLTAPTYAWEFVYVAGISDAYKWLFLGGDPKRVEVGAAGTYSGGAYGDPSVAGPSFVVPRAGLWFVHHGAEGVTAGWEVDIYFNAAPPGTFRVLHNDATARSNSGSVVGTVAAAGGTIKQQARVASGTATISNRWMNVLPRRLS